jgi:FKBP-type peptidyl-prolyl cis-trans isomerase
MKGPGEVVSNEPLVFCLGLLAGLKAKEQRMHELVAIAERREAACKAEIGQLLASRSAMFESSKAAAAMAAAAAAAAEEAAEEANAAGQQEEEDVEAAHARIEAAERRMDMTQVGWGAGTRPVPASMIKAHRKAADVQQCNMQCMQLLLALAP